MLQVFDDHVSNADDVSRREWLRLGTASAAGMASFFGRRATSAPSAQHEPHQRFGNARRAILFWLTGRAPQQQSWDVKTEAPLEVRDPFRAIASRTPGLDV